MKYVITLNDRKYEVEVEVAEAMAKGARERLLADIAVSATGMASPGNPEEPPAGTVFVGVASERGVRAIPLNLVGSRQEIRRQTVEAALVAILQEVNGSSPVQKESDHYGL